jgi:glutaconate CoA-transferase, subunit A
VAYCFGHELRGLSPASRRMVESGQCQVVAEISNAGYQWRFLAAAMGLSFIPARDLLGTDTLAHSSAKVVADPWSGKPICLLPACYPDVAIIHVTRCDRYGNAQVDGTIMEDFELARAARRLILTTEEIVPEEQIRDAPWRTVIPFFLVDAVAEVPYGSHPCQMPRRYYFDEDHIREWMRRSATAEGAEAYFQEYVFGVADFNAYLEEIGGLERLGYLRDVEALRA